MGGRVTGLVNDYKARRTDGEVEIRINKHLEPFFRGRWMASITTSDVREFIAYCGYAARKVDQYAAQKVGHSEGGSFYVFLIYDSTTDPSFRIFFTA